MRILQKLIFGFSLFLPFLGMAATLTGPETAEPGRLIVFQADIEGDWWVYPPDGADLAKDTDGKTLYFVPHKKGTLTLIFFGVEDLKPVISQTAVQIGPAPKPEPVPDPEPEPAPQIKLTQTEKQAAISAFQAVINGIDARTIRTPQGARSAFKQSLTQKASDCSGGYCQLSAELSAALEAWTEQTDFTSLDTIKSSFQNILKELK